MGETYSLGTILAIAIPLGVVCLISVLFLMILVLRYSCIAARERRAYNMIRTGNYMKSSTSNSLPLDAESSFSMSRNGRSACFEVLCCMPSPYFGERHERRSSGSCEDKGQRRISPNDRSGHLSRSQQFRGSAVPAADGSDQLERSTGTHVLPPVSSSRERRVDSEGRIYHSDASNVQHVAQPTPSSALPLASQATRPPFVSRLQTGTAICDIVTSHPSFSERREISTGQRSHQNTDLSAFDSPAPPVPLFRGHLREPSVNSPIQVHVGQSTPSTISSRRSYTAKTNRELLNAKRPATPAKSILRNKGSAKSLATQRSEFSNTPRLVEELKETEINSAASIASHNNISGRAESDRSNIPPRPHISTIDAPLASPRIPSSEVPSTSMQSTPMMTPQESLNNSAIASPTSRLGAENIMESDTTQQRITEWFRTSLDAPPKMPFLSSVKEPHDSSLFASTRHWGLGDEAEKWWLHGQSSQMDSSDLKSGLEFLSEGNMLNESHSERFATPGQVSRERLLLMLQRDESIKEGCERVGRTEVGGPSPSKFPSFAGSVVNAGQPGSKVSPDVNLSNESKSDLAALAIYQGQLHVPANIEKDTSHWDSEDQNRWGTSSMTASSAGAATGKASVHGLRINQGDNPTRYAGVREAFVSENPSQPDDENNQFSHSEADEPIVQANNLVQYRTQLASPLLLSNTEFSHSSRSSSLTSSSVRLREPNSSQDSPMASRTGTKPQVGFARLPSRVQRPDPFKPSGSIREIASLREPESPRSPGYEPGQTVGGGRTHYATGALRGSAPRSRGRQQARRKSASAYRPSDTETSIKQKSTVPSRPTPKSASINKPLPATPLILDDGVIANLGGSKFVAIQPYTAQLADELGLIPGDVVRVFEVFDDGWCLARIIESSYLPASRTSRGVCPRICLSEYTV